MRHDSSARSFSDDAGDSPTNARQGARRPPERLDLARAWQLHASDWVAWARAPMHDSYWRFHRDQFLTLLPTPGVLTVDVGAGEGRLSRDLRDRGHRVVGVEIAHALAVAAQQTESATEMVVGDAAALPLRTEVADLAVAFMSLQDVDDVHGSLLELARVLKPGGRLCAAIVHPLNSAGRFDNDEPDSRFVIESSYLATANYVDEVERDGLSMTFSSAHRPLETYISALSDAGFVVERLREPSVPEEAIRSPKDRRWQRVPLFLHIRAIRR